jgi:hypothetical protein
MSTDTDFDQIVNEAATEARGTFDLKARLTGGTKRTDSIRVFTDEETGEELGGQEVDGFIDTPVGRMPRIRRWGIAQELVELEQDNEGDKNANAIAQLKERARELAKKLDESALVIDLQAVPPVIKKDARRAAKAHLSIHGKIPEAREDEYIEEYQNQLTQRSLVAITDVQSGGVIRNPSIENARDLRDLLPDSEYGRLADAVSKLQFQKVIGDQATAHADF